MSIGYTISIGSDSFGNDGLARGQSRPVLEIESDTGIGSGGGWCRLHLGDPTWVEPGVGDEVSVDLDAGDGATRIFTGEIESIDRSTSVLRIRARDAIAKLSRADVEGSYEESSVGDIVTDLIDQAGADAGEIEAGPTFPSYVVFRGPRALRHIQKLGNLAGAETCGDGEGKIHFRRPTPGTTADHRLVWGTDILDVDLQATHPTTDSFEVWGEGAAGSEGPERSHWLTTDLSSVTGDAQIQSQSPATPGTVSPGTGTMPRIVSDGAIRSTEVASDVASAQAQLVAVQLATGHAVCLGRLDIAAGQWVELADLPNAATGVSTFPTTLRVRRVIHRFALGRGLITQLEF